MQTEIIYNGVPIRDVLTDGISHTVVKDSTGVDQIGVHVSAEFTGVVHASTNQLQRGVKVAQLGSGLADVLRLLTKDRRTFQMRIGGAVLYNVQPGAVEASAPRGTVTSNLLAMDIDHGPKPSVQVLDVKAGYSATIRFRIEFTIPNCGPASPGGESTSGLINFRFWIAEDVNCQTWLTTRTYSGRIRVAHKNIPPHLWARAVTIPPQQLGFKRNVVGLHESEDGLHLDFTIQDVEIVAAPPWDVASGRGASDWDGKFQVSTTNGAYSETDLSLRLIGPKNTTKIDLLTLAMKVVSQKTHILDLLGRNDPKEASAVLVHFAAEESLKDNEISVSCRLRHSGKEQFLLAIFGTGGKLELGAPLGPMGIGYNPNVAIKTTTTATLTGLFLSTLQTPCSPATMPQAVDQQTKREAYTQVTQGYQDPNPPSQPKYDDGSPFSQAHLKAMYLRYKIDSKLEFHTGKLALPIGTSSATGDTHDVVTLHRPCAHRQISIEAERVNQPPEIPKLEATFKDFNSITHTPVGCVELTSAVPQLSADSRNLIYAARMDIRYALSRAPRASETIPVGGVPYFTPKAGDSTRFLPTDVFLKPEEILA